MTSELPVHQNERVALLDVLRGFALFGVLLVNMHAIVLFTSPPDMLAAVTLPVDGVLDQIHHWLFETKFVTLFAMLFGYGFGLLLKRLEAKGVPVSSFFARRMGILFALGLLNLCLWWADILHVYAVAGMLLLLFRRASDRWVMVASVFLALGLPWASFGFSSYLFPAFDLALTQELHPYLRSGNVLTIAEGNYRIYQVFYKTGIIVPVYAYNIGCIFFGYWLLRKDFFGRLEVYVRKVKFLWWISLAFIAVPWGFVYAGKAGLLDSPWVYYGVFPLYQGVSPGISLFYSTSVILLYRMGVFSRIFRAFSYVGRMTLTNYLTQSVLYVIFFYGVGFGLLGHVAYRHIWLLCIVFYVLQVFFSAWWLKHYQYGPVEWLWRQLSYGKRFPLRRVAISPV